jgi:multicomponent K+:H+ antiporter subunit G
MSWNNPQDFYQSFYQSEHMIHPAWEWLAASLLIIGAAFLLIGTLGMARLPDFYMRLHAPTKATTLGLGGVLCTSMLLAAVHQRAGFAEVLIMLFVFVTAPVSANLLAQAALHLRVASLAPAPEDAVPERQRP